MDGNAPLGAQARAADRRRTSRRDEGAAADGRGGDRPRRRVAGRLRVLDGELDATAARRSSSLMEIFTETIERELPDLVRQGVRTRFIGRRDRAPDALRERMAALEHETEAQPRLNLWIAFDYGGRAEIVDAARTAPCARDRRGRRGDVRLVPQRARDARPRSADPHVRRAEGLELPPVAARLRRARLRRHALAGLRRRASSAPRSTTTPAAGAASAADEPRSSRASLVAVVGLPLVLGARVGSAAGGCSRSSRSAALLALHEYALMTRRSGRSPSRRYVGALLALARRAARRARRGRSAAS